MQKQLERIRLLSGDKALIAEGLGVSIVTVGDTLKERRGKRTTVTQLKIKKAAEFFIKKNREKLEFCMKLASENNPDYNIDIQN